jgi:hypothetical protein
VAESHAPPRQTHANPLFWVLSHVVKFFLCVFFALGFALIGAIAARGFHLATFTPELVTQTERDWITAWPAAHPLVHAAINLDDRFARWSALANRTNTWEFRPILTRDSIRSLMAALGLVVLIPLFLCAFADGLVERDLRKFGGANESSTKYHLAKTYATAGETLALFTYLIWPKPIHLNAYLLLAGLPSAAMVYFAVANYKKVL